MPLTSLSFLDIDSEWPPPEEAARLDQHAACRRLFEGDHEKVFDQWYRLLRSDTSAALEIILNWPKRLSTLWADLVVGEEPRFSAGERDSAEQDRLKDLLDRTRYVSVLYEGVIDLSRYGIAVFKTTRKDGEPKTSVQPPYYWFPVTSIGDVRDVRQHVLAFTYTKRDKSPYLRREIETEFLKVEIHEKGTVEHRLYRIKTGRLETELPATSLREDFPEIAGDIRGERIVEETGVDDFLISFATGLRGSDRLLGLDDYKDLEGILQEFEVRIAQISRVLDEHADPNMYGSPSAITVDPVSGASVFEGGGKFFPIDENGTPPGYMVWEGELNAAYKELEVLMEQFYLVSETSPAAFGKMDAGLAPSGTALRRLMHAPLKKAERIQAALAPVALRMIELMAELEDADSFESGPSLEGVQATWNDGLPQDENEQTQLEAQRVAGLFGSRFSAIKRIDGVDDEQAEAEMNRIEEEQQAQTEATQIAPDTLQRTQAIFGRLSGNGSSEQPGR